MKTSTKLSFLIILIITSTSLKAQDTLLLGKWQLVEMQQGSVIIFDRDHPDVMLENARSNQKHLDTVVVKKPMEMTQHLMHKMYYEFLANYELKAGLRENRDWVYAFVEKEGEFQVDGAKIGLILSGSTETYTYKIISDTLILIPIFNGKASVENYARYVKQSKAVILSDPPPLQQELPKNYVEASFPTGKDSASVWVQENVYKFPVIVEFFTAHGLTSTFLKLRILEDGHPEFNRSTHELPENIDEQFRQLILQMPDWNPASVNGENVRSTVLVKVHFNKE